MNINVVSNRTFPFCALPHGTFFRKKNNNLSRPFLYCLKINKEEYYDIEEGCFFYKSEEEQQEQVTVLNIENITFSIKESFCEKKESS